MKRDWPRLFEKLKPGLSFKAAARRLRGNYQTVRYHAILNGYRFKDGRRQRAKLRVDEIDWSRSDREIARDFLVSKQRVNVVRKRFQFSQPSTSLTKKKGG